MCPQQGKQATSEKNLTHCRNVCIFTCVYTSGAEGVRLDDPEGSLLTQHILGSCDCTSSIPLWSWGHTLAHASAQWDNITQYLLQSNQQKR